MPAPLITWRDEFDVLVPAGTFHNFGTVLPGSPTTPVTRNLHNGFGLTGGSAVDTAQNVLIIPEARLTATGGQWKGRDIALLEALALQIQIPDVPLFAGFTAVGTGVSVRVPDLPTDSFHNILVRALLPAGAPEVSVQFKLGVQLVRTSALGDPAAFPPGISRGVGRGVGGAVFDRDQPFLVSGLDNLRWPTYSYYLTGRPYSVLGGLLSGDETISNADGSAVALATTEAYGFLTTLQVSGRVVVKGNKIVGTPAFPADFPAAPAGSILTGFGIRFADVDTTDLEHTELVDSTPKFCQVTVSGLTYTVQHVGVDAIVSGRKNDNQTPNSADFPGDGTHTVWLLADGSIDDTAGPDGDAPETGALRLADIPITSSVEVGGRVDYRRWRDKQIEIIQQIQDPIDTDLVSWRNPGSERLWVRPDQVRIQVSGHTGVDGLLQVESFVQADNGAEVTNYTSNATDDRRPWIGFRDAGDVIQIDDPAGSPIFTDFTAAFNNPTAADVNPFPAAEAVGDQFLIAYEARFDKVILNVSTAATTGSIVLKYWDGTAFVALTEVTDDTADLTITGVNGINWRNPGSAWASVSTDSGPELFPIVLELASVFTGSDPVLTQGRITHVSEIAKGEPEVLVVNPGELLVHRVTVSDVQIDPEFLVISTTADLE